MNRCLIFSANDTTKISRLGISRAAGSHRIATELREHGWDAEVIDFFYFWKDEELYELIRSRLKDLRFIGFSFTSNMAALHSKVVAFSRWVRKNYPHIIIIAGAHKPARDADYFDYYVVGYGENALHKLLSYLFSNGEKPIITSFGSTNVVSGDLYKSFSLSNPTIIYEDRDFIRPGEWGNIEFSRGCIFKCKFCDFPNLGVKYDATRTADGVRHQFLHAYDNYGIEHYLITDNTFNDYTDKIIKFADVVETLPWKPYFSAFVRADLLVRRPKEKEEMLRMGVLSQAYGVETFNRESARYIGKSGDPKKLQDGLNEVNEWYKKMGVGDLYRPTLYLIAGLPYETKESLESTIKWVKDVWFPRVSFLSTLEINRDKHEFIQAGLAADYQKLGYYEITGDIKLPTGNIPFEEQVIWANEHMTIFDALEYTHKFEDMYGKGWGGLDLKRLQTFLIQTIMVDNNNNPLDLKTKLRLTQSSMLPYINNTETIFVRNYIDKKLSI